jgi:DNA-directed RNA polymerase II subunit RPB2
MNDNDFDEEREKELNDINDINDDTINLDEFHFKFIDKYFKEVSLVDHHLHSCNQFYEQGISKIFRDINPLKYTQKIRINNAEEGEDLKEENYKGDYYTNIYVGGKNGDKIYYGKPVVFDKTNIHYMFPNEARLRNMTYGISIHYDVDIELSVEQENEEPIIINKTIPSNNSHFFLGMFPIMLQSNLCVLNGLPRETKYNMGECKHDYGGYFIIDGKEKVVIPQEKFGNNLIYTRKLKNGAYDYSVEIKSVSEDISKPRRTLSIMRMGPSASRTNGQFHVLIPNVRKPIPLFIVMRALGIISDKDICKVILHDIDYNNKYLETLRPSIHDASIIYNQVNAIEYIGSCTKYVSVQEAYNCLINQLLPHVGEMNFKSKAMFIGYMVLELLKVIHQEEKPTDRDNYKYKRVDTTGYLMGDLFREYATIMYTQIFKKLNTTYFYNKAEYNNDDEITAENCKFISLFKNEYFEEERYIERGFQKAFKGNWGDKAHTKRIGVLQAIDRMTYHTFLSHMRRIDLDIDTSNKLIGPHLLHGSQWGYMDPIDVGGSIGINKQMTLMCKITEHVSIYEIINWLHKIMDKDEETTISFLEEVEYEDLYSSIKLFINGTWIGIIKNPLKFKLKFITARRTGLISPFISFSFTPHNKTINICSDGGRLVRPVFYLDKGVVSYKNRDIDDLSWWDCVYGLLNKKREIFMDNSILSGARPKELMNSCSIIEYIDNSEAETSYITSTIDKIKNKINNEYTHLEIHPSVIFGIMGSQVVFPENTALARNDYSCIQGRQSVSIYHSNYLNRIDNMGIILNYGQKPLVKSRYTKYINEEEHPYGQNAIVAIMSHTGYNVEDSILFNESSIKRGLFGITYYSMYETYEETETKISKSEKRIANVMKYNVSNIKAGYNYNELDENGIIKEGTVITDKTVIIGRIEYSKDNPDVIRDASIFSSKGHEGIVDKVYITNNEEGRRIAKVRIREERYPNYGDKFASRCGQKGTIGMIIPEENMPFTKDGLRPDLIINPHCIPSRMTINQLVEAVFCKVGVTKGCSIESTPFVNKGPKDEVLGKMLNEYGFHSSGNEVLYNGMTGQQIESLIYMGPTYYTRLKHMTKDKINARARGPRAALTRQTNHGRANDGGIRIGEMERDAVVAYGMSSFMYDSMMTRGDAYRMAICNHSGTIAIYNKDTNNLYSPMIDGPLVFDKVDNEKLVPRLITKYGKEFSIVEIPYCLKLLIQELSSMNVQIRLITADNIKQLTEINTNTNYTNFYMDYNDFENKKKESIESVNQAMNASLYQTNEQFKQKYDNMGLTPPYFVSNSSPQFSPYTSKNEVEAELNNLKNSGQLKPGEYEELSKSIPEINKEAIEQIKKPEAPITSTEATEENEANEEEIFDNDIEDLDTESTESTEPATEKKTIRFTT